MSKRLAIALTALVWVAVSCKVGPDYATPPAPVAGEWSAKAAVTNRAFSVAEDHWWRSFGDDTLNRLVETAFQGNLSLQSAGTSILQARAQLNRSIGNLFPQQQAVGGQIGYTRLLSTATGTKLEYVSDQVLFAATWEIDFWGKYRRAIESDRAVFLATVATYDDALVTVLADVASSYVNLRTLEEQMQVAARNVDLQRESLRIARAQFNAGETSERDVQQATAQLAQTEAQIPLLKGTLCQIKAGLAVLLGKTPDQVEQLLGTDGRIPTAPPAVAAGIPHDLLRRRPDVRAAGLAAASKCALIGVAKANLYPAFSLSGDFGFTSTSQGTKSLSDIFMWQNRAVDTAAGLTFPVFNYGRLKNLVRVQDAQFQQAVLNYQNAVLAAQAEVEAGLASFAGQQEAVVKLNQAAEAARRSTSLAMYQYKGGQTDYTTVLSAEQAQLAVEQALTSARGNVALALVSVYRALGGGWQIREGHDVVSDEIKTEMARRTDWGKLLEPGKHLPQTEERSDFQAAGESK